MDWFTDLPAIGAGVGAAVGAGMVAFRKYAKAEQDKAKKAIAENNDVIAAVAAQTEIYANMQRILQETGADRVILLKMHNGGDIIRNTATQIYITVFAEMATGGIVSVQKDFQTRAVYDRHYLALLRNVAMAKSVQIWEKEMADDELLKGVYTAAGIKTSVVTEVFSEPGKYWMLSTSWKREHTASPADRAVMAGAAGTIQNLLKKDLLG